jgi:hypothetical protein
MTEKKRPEKRGDVQTEGAHKNDVRTEERIQEENRQGIQVAPLTTEPGEGGALEDDKRSQEAGGEESQHGRKQKGNSEPN